MVRNVKIENFKSISSLELELGRFNVFIGENGSGKSNLLEAFAMASAAQDATIKPAALDDKGIRVTRPNLTYSAFKGYDPRTEVSVQFNIEIKEHLINLPITLIAENSNQIEASWRNSRMEQILSASEQIEQENKQMVALIEKLETELSEIKAQKVTNNHQKKLVLSEQVRETLDRVKFGENASNISVVQAWIAELPAINYLKDFVIYSLNILALRGIVKDSLIPLGIHGENLDTHIFHLSDENRERLRDYYKYIQWLDDIEVDIEDRHKTEGYKLGKSTSLLYLTDRYLNQANNLMSAESANEGVLFLLFYLVLFLSPQAPRFFAIDNIEQALNPRLARELISVLARLAKEKNKQTLITTHDPAILDGLNLYDDEQRLFVVSRREDGATAVKRVTLNGESKREFKLSEMWMRGSLGAVPTNF